MHGNNLRKDISAMAKLHPTLAAVPIRLPQLAILAALTLCIVCHAVDAPPRPRPVLELLFDGNLTDTSDAARTGAANGTVTFVDGKHSKCASFDGQNWIDTNFPQTELGGEFTIECWVNPADHQGPHVDIFGNHVSEGLGLVLQQDGVNTNQFYAAYGVGDKEWVMTDAVTLAPGRWQHVALVKTQEGLRIYLNGVLVATKDDTTPALPSPMPLAVGLGYTEPARCFRGLIDDFRIWNTALTEFGHARIDPAATAETRARYLHATPRPAAAALKQSWTLATDDTRITLGVTAAGELVVRGLSCPAVGQNWIANPVAIRLWPHVEVAGQCKSLRWRFVDATVDETDGQKLTFKFACDAPPLEVTSQWHASLGPGPVHHSMQIKNLSDQPVTIGEQPTFDLDLAGATDMWCFHSDGITPDPVGVYQYPLTGDDADARHTIRTAPNGQFIPYVVLDANQDHGVYLGLEWSVCRIEAAALESDESAVRVRGGNIADLREELAPGETLEVRPGFLGAYRGDLDDAGNRLRRWLFRYCVPDVLRQDASYPKVQWNAFGATGKTPGSWDPVESKYYPLIDDIAPLGFEEVMIDVAWWQGDEPDSDQVDWSSGMRKAADYAHDHGMRFGLYWTDRLDMADPAARQQRAARIRRLFEEYGADMWRSDCTRGEVIGASYAATRGFYEMVDSLAREIPNFQWENCSGGGRIKDFGAMRRAVKIFNSDTYSALHVRQAFYDSSYVYPPIQLEGHLGSTDGRFRPRGVKGMRYAFRSTSMGAPEWFLDAPNGGNGSEPWTQAEKDALKACVETYKARIRPLVRNADLYHVLPRPDGVNRDAIEYYEPDTGEGVVFLFQPSSDVSTEPLRLKGLEADQKYRVTFEEGTHPPTVKSGRELMEKGLPATLEGPEASELIFLEFAR
jgi:concanavalin A-like lectin/glucanase superfamily protein/melibiase-like protein/glycosyl hydrolase family 36